MSFQAITWAFEIRTLKPGQKLVLVALCNRADEDWSCYPSVGRIADETGFSDRAVRGHLDSLEECGVIKRTRTRNSDGTLGRYRFFIQRQNVPVAECARGKKVQEKQEPEKIASGPSSGKKRRSPAAESAGHNRQLEPSEDIREIFECLWSDVWPAIGRKRTTGNGKKSAKEFAFEIYRNAAKEAGSPERLNAACKRWVMDRSNNAEQFAPGLNRFLRDRKWEHYLPQAIEPNETADWDVRVRGFYRFDNWHSDWGPRPDENGCCAPEAVIQQYQKQHAQA